MEDIDTTNMGSHVLTYYKKLSSLPIIKPKNGVEYSRQVNSYKCGNETDGKSHTGKKVHLRERQVNYANCLAEGKYDMVECYVISGYSIKDAFNRSDKQVIPVKENLSSKAKRAKTVNVMALSNYLRYDGAVELNIDATWLLNEQVNLYEEVKQAKKYTQAIRLLHDISFHVDVDARVSNRLEIEGTVDYEALLNKANSRVIEGAVVVEALEEQSPLPAPMSPSSGGA